MRGHLPGLDDGVVDIDSGLASGQVLGTPTLFIDGILHRGGYDPPTLLAALAP
jgi:protein-disulfide isomerase